MNVNKQLVVDKTTSIFEKLNADSPINRALIADLRKRNAENIEEDIKAWKVIYSVDWGEEVSEYDQKLLSRALYASLVIYASQRRKGGSHNFEALPLGKVFAMIGRDKENFDSKVTALFSSEQLDSLVRKIKTILRLSSVSYSLDYTKLTYDLYRVQKEDPRRIYMAWGMDYYRKEKKGEE